CGFGFAGGGEDFAEAAAYDDFFAGLDGHGDELDVVGSFALLGGGLHGLLRAFANGFDEAGVVRAEDFDAGIALAKRGDAIGEREATSFLIPGNLQRGIAVAVVRNVDAGGDAGNGFDKLGDAIDAGVPLGVELFWIGLEPGFDGSEHADHFFLADLHWAADGAFPRRAVAKRGIDQVLAAEQDAAALRTLESFAAGEAVEIDLHLGVEREIVRWRNTGGVVEKHGDVVRLGSGEIGGEFVAEVGGVDHRGLFVDGVGDFVGVFDEDEFGAGEADGVVKGAAAADHDDFVLHSGGVGELPDFLGIAASHAGRSGGGHGTGGAGRDQAGLRASEFGE